MASSTTEGVILAALLARAAALSFTPALKLVLPRVTADAAEGTPYLKVWHLPANTDSPCLDTDGFDDFRGVLQIDVMWPFPAKLGLNEPTEIAGAIVAHFARGIAMVRSGVTVTVTKRPSIGPTLEDGAWTKTPVSVYYMALV